MDLKVMLKEILTAHKKWLESNGKEGTQAVLNSNAHADFGCCRGWKNWKDG